MLYSHAGPAIYAAILWAPPRAGGRQQGEPRVGARRTRGVVARKIGHAGERERERRMSFLGHER